METINNIASAASNTAQAAVKAVWGEGNQEPVSGKTGNVAAGEPYDAGNIEPKHGTGVTGTDKVVPTEISSKLGLGRSEDHTTHHHEHGASSGVTGPEELIESSKPIRETGAYDNATTGSAPHTSTSHSTSGLSSGVIGSEKTLSESQPTRETSGYDNATTTETALRPKKVSSSVDTPSYDNTSSSHESHSGATKHYEGAPKFNDNITTSTGGAGFDSHKTESSSGGYDVSKTESSSGYDASKTHSSSGVEERAPHKAADSSVTNRDLSGAQQDIRDPSDEKADPDHAAKRSNVDDADGGLDKDNNPDKLEGPGPRSVAEVARAHGGDAGKAVYGEKTGSATSKPTEDETGPNAPSHGEGTGEKHVKTTGLAADGGDFDATKPGAGSEADRLLETKGIHHAAPGATGGSGAAAHDAAGDHKEKKSLGEKIKEKLHRHKDH